MSSLCSSFFHSQCCLLGISSDSAYLSEASLSGWAELPSGDADLAPRTPVDSELGRDSKLLNGQSRVRWVPRSEILWWKVLEKHSAAASSPSPSLLLIQGKGEGIIMGEKSPPCLRVCRIGLGHKIMCILSGLEEKKGFKYSPCAVLRDEQRGIQQEQLIQQVAAFFFSRLEEKKKSGRTDTCTMNLSCLTGLDFFLWTPSECLSHDSKMPRAKCWRPCCTPHCRHP